MDIFEKYIEFNDDFENLGIFYSKYSMRYFCTPVNSTILGTTGVDGDHFVSLNIDDKKTLANQPICKVTPMWDEYVKVVAKNFEEFIRLLITLRDVNIILECVDYPLKRITETYKEVDYDDVSKSIERIKEEFKIEEFCSVEEAYNYIQENIKSDLIDYVKYSPEYYELIE